jgi:hypothetical protein
LFIHTQNTEKIGFLSRGFGKKSYEKEGEKWGFKGFLN